MARYSPDYEAWISDRMVHVPPQVQSFCGDLTGLKILDLGAGDMIMSLGLLALGPAEITGLDVHRRPFDVIEHAASEVTKRGLAVTADYKKRLRYVAYDGRRFPFQNDTFDLVFSWGAFEHISNVKLALSECRRVVTATGRIFVAVAPWYYSYQGSHLADCIPEPYFHLRHTKKWVFERLKEYLKEHPEQVGMHLAFWRPEGYTFENFLLEHMYGEYCTLNRCSPRKFLEYALRLGMMIERMETRFDERADAANIARVPYADLITEYTTVLFRPCKRPQSARSSRSRRAHG